MKVAGTLTTRDIGEAENALRANLLKTIATMSLDYGHWVAIQMITHGKASTSAAELSKSLKISVGNAQELLDALQERGIIYRELGKYCISESSNAAVERIRDEVKKITTAVFRDLDQNDSIAAHRVLSIITERASNLLDSP